MSSIVAYSSPRDVFTESLPSNESVRHSIPYLHEMWLELSRFYCPIFFSLALQPQFWALTYLYETLRFPSVFLPIAPTNSIFVRVSVVVLASTVLLGFASCRNPCPYFSFHDFYVFWNGTFYSTKGGVWLLLVTPLLLGVTQAGTHSLTVLKLVRVSQSRLHINFSYSVSSRMYDADRRRESKPGVLRYLNSKRAQLKKKHTKYCDTFPRSNEQVHC
jgi:hypothetical protein